MGFEVNRCLAAIVLLASLGCGAGRESENESDPDAESIPRYTAPKSELTLEDLKTLRALLVDEQYEELDRRLRAVQEAYEQDPDKEYPTYLVYSVFAVIDPSLEPRLENWTTVMPDSYSAHVARGAYHAAKGRLSRGGRYINMTSKEELDGMRQSFDIAQDELDKAVALNPRLVYAYARLIEIEQVGGSRKRAAELLQRSLQHDPYAFMVRYAYTGVLEPKWGGSYAEMRSFAEESMEHLDKNPKLILLKGAADAEQGMMTLDQGEEVRVELYDKALRYGDTVGVMLLKADSLYAMKRYAEALEISNRILEICPVLLGAYRTRALCHHRLGDEEEALKDLGMVLSLVPTDPSTLSVRADIHRDAAHYEESLRDVEAALAVRPYAELTWVKKGEILMLHLGREDDAEQAFKRAIEVNPEVAAPYYYLGLLGKKREDPEADDYLQKAMERDKTGFYHANLAYRYREGSYVPRDEALATLWFEKAAQMGNLYAQLNLGRRYLSGVGGVVDYAAAYHWLQIAAERGDPDAMCHLGLMYDRGYEVYRDRKEAAKWYWRSARGGYLRAYYNLAVSYSNGEGVESDLVTAYMLVVTAAAKGDDEARRYLPRLQGQLTPEQMEEAKRRLDEGETGLEKGEPG